MQLCTKHWAQLKAAIEARGLSQFVAQDGEELARRLTVPPELERERAAFEPLMGATMAIFSNTLNTAGLVVMEPNEDGTERCPICFLVTNCPCGKGDECPYSTWIDRAADDQREHASKLGLFGSA